MDVFTNNVHESVDFFVKNQKKWYLIDFYSPKYSVVLAGLTLYDQLSVRKQLFFHEKLHNAVTNIFCQKNINSIKTTL